MAGEWIEVPFPEVIDFQEGPGILAKDFRDEGVPLVRLSGLERSGSVLSGCNYLDPEMVARKWAHFALATGDVLLSTSASLGRIAVVGEDAVGAIPYTGIIRMRPRDGRLIAPFLRYLLEGPDFQQQAEMVGVGSVIRHFGPMHLRQMSVKLPPPDDQRAIAHILGTLDDKIELNRRMSETLEAMARALFKAWFVDFEPVRAKCRGDPGGRPCWRRRLPGKGGFHTRPYDDLFPDRLVDSELGQIPEGWRVGRLGEYTENFDSKRVPLSSREREKLRGIYPYYGAAGVVDYVNDYLFDGIYVLVGEDGSVVTESGHAMTQYVWGKFWVNNHAHVLQGRHPVSTEQLYLYFAFESVAPYVTGAVQPKLSQGRMNTMPFLFAGDKVCLEFQRLIEPWFTTYRKRSEESRTLAALRDALLPKLIRGEIRVKDAERFLKERGL